MNGDEALRSKNPTGFIRRECQSLFSRARLINVLKPRLKFKGVRVRCPKCGEIGVLRIRRRKEGVLFYIYHGRSTHYVTRLIKSGLKSGLEEILEEVT